MSKKTDDSINNLLNGDDSVSDILKNDSVSDILNDNLSLEELEKQVKERINDTFYQIVKPEQKGYRAVISISHEKEETLRKMLMLSLSGYLFRVMCDTQLFTVKDKKVIERFLNYTLQFNPEYHIASAYEPDFDDLESKKLREKISATIPPKDSLLKWNEYHSHNYEDIKKLTEKMFPETLISDFLIQIHGVFKDDEEMEIFKKQFFKQPLPVYDVNVGQWVCISPNAENLRKAAIPNDEASKIMKQYIENKAKDEQVMKNMYKYKIAIIRAANEKKYGRKDENFDKVIEELHGSLGNNMYNDSETQKQIDAYYMELSDDIKRNLSTEDVKMYIDRETDTYVSSEAKKVLPSTVEMEKNAKEQTEYEKKVMESIPDDSTLMRIIKPTKTGVKTDYMVYDHNEDQR